MKKYFLVGLILFLALGLLTINEGVKAQEELSFGPQGNLTALGVSKKSFAKGYYGGGALTKTLRFSIDLGKCSLHRMGKYHYLKVGDLRPYTRPGEPLLPMKTFRVILPKETEVLGVEVISGQYVTIENRLRISPTPQPIPRFKGETIGGGTILSKEVYSQKTYFPGKLVSYYTGTDKEKRYVFVRFYPVQHIPKNKETILFTSATINLYYQ